MKDHSHDDACRDDRGPCDCLPRPVRMNYFHGQLISERDLRTEQKYFREKLRHTHRCLHGYGVICGLEVRPVPPPEDCLPDDSARRRELRSRIAALDAAIRALEEEAGEGGYEKREKEFAARLDALAAERETLHGELDGLEQARGDSDAACEDDREPLHRVRITCGAAIDCDGNDIVLHADRIVDVLRLLDASERERLGDGSSHRLYLSLCYEECELEPTRPFVMDSCSATNACQMARVAEGARLTASLTRPETDERCDPCCVCCEQPCLLLAALTLARDEPIVDGDIDHSVRRRFGLYDPTVITGISWAHGATYTAATANAILGTKDEDGGIEIAFSRPIHVSTIVPGTIELLRVTGGRGLSGVIAAMEGEFVDLPAGGMVDRVRYRDATGESVQPKDRILIVVRTPFLLDDCCRAVEGLHVGGRVPRLEFASKVDETARDEEGRGGIPARETCTHPPHGPMPWTTSGPGNFESWFWIADE